jgi:hypothetical protein
MGLIDHAKTELEIAGLFDKEGDFYEGDTGKAVMELIELFSKQGHSGMSAPIVADLFKRLANYQPLQPITGKDEEWVEVLEHRDSTNKSWYQNKRCSTLFKDGKDGKPYYINAIVKRDQRGITWSGRAWLNEEDWLNGDRNLMVDKRGYVKSFPFTPKTFYIDVKDVEVSKDDWESFVVDPSQLDEVWEYYDKD